MMIAKRHREFMIMRYALKYQKALLAALLGGALIVCAPLSAADAPRLADAAAKQDKATVRALIRDKANVNSPQPDGATALHWAVHWDDLETADLLIGAGANVNAKNDYSATPLSLACTNGNAAMVEKLLAAGASPNLAASSGETPLMRCARTGSAAAVKSLLARKAEVNAQNSEQGQTALMWAVAQKHPAVTDVLIKGGADIRARSKAGFTPLLFAARVGDVESADLLLAAGANVNETAPNGMTPLVLASASGQEELGLFLLDKGANPNARDELGATALHYAVMKGITALNQVRYANYVAHIFRPSMTNLVKALLAHKADPNAAVEKPVPLGGSRSTGVVGATPYLLAAASPDPDVMRVLASAGADPKAKTRNGYTALMLAAGLGRGQDFTDPEKGISLEAVRIAFDAGIDVNAANEDGLTAMHGAAANGADGVVQFLAAKGAKLDVKDRYQQTPLSIAAGERLPWIPYGDELGEIIQPSTRDLLLKLGATPLTMPGYFTPPSEESDAYRINRGQRGLAAPK
jgi:ankyrin repeat protein